MIDWIIIEKSKRTLTALSQGCVCFTARAALGKEPIGPKGKSGDFRTPEGTYYVCIKKQEGKFGASLGISYPSPDDALRSGAPDELLEAIRIAWSKQERPPWGSMLGGEIYIHGGGTDSDWTAGCIALSDEDAAFLFRETPLKTRVSILP